MYKSVPYDSKNSIMERIRSNARTRTWEDPATQDWWHRDEFGGLWRSPRGAFLFTKEPKWQDVWERVIPHDAAICHTLPEYNCASCRCKYGSQRMYLAWYWPSIYPQEWLLRNGKYKNEP